MEFYRDKRIANLIREIMSEMLMSGEIKDPRVSGFITVSDVTLTRDLRNATIYISVLGSNTDRNKVLKGLNSAKKFIKVRLAKELKIKYMPEIKFKTDQSIEDGMKLYKKIEELNTENNNEGEDEDQIESE